MSGWILDRYLGVKGHQDFYLLMAGFALVGLAASLLDGQLARKAASSWIDTQVDRAWSIRPPWGNTPDRRKWCQYQVPFSFTYVLTTKEPSISVDSAVQTLMFHPLPVMQLKIDPFSTPTSAAFIDISARRV
jgi:hypothetical protein